MPENLNSSSEKIDFFYWIKLVQDNGFRSLNELESSDQFRSFFLDLDDFFTFLISDIFLQIEQNKDLEHIDNNREKLFEIIMTFLDILHGYELFIKILFFHKNEIAKIVIKNQKSIYFLIYKFLKKYIKVSHDYKIFFYTIFFKAALLKTLGHWVDDDTADKSDTMMYLDKILENGARYKDIDIANFFNFNKFF